MVKRDELIQYIQKLFGKDLLDKAENLDEVANGVQIIGGDEVDLVTLGVSLNEEFLVKAIKDQSNFCIFHHGFDPRVYKGRYSKSAQKRLRLIFQNNLSILGYHYALDAHPEIGNNAQIIHKLGAKIKEPIFDEWGYSGSFDRPRRIDELKSACEDLFGREIFVTSGENEAVRTIGVVSGAGKTLESHFREFEKKGIELYISGEGSESLPHKFSEIGISYFLCGHYMTETLGIKALGEKIKHHFGDKIMIEFIDVPNPL